MVCESSFLFDVLTIIPTQTLNPAAATYTCAGNCNFDQKAAYAEAAGAVAALVFDNLMGAYFVLGTNQRK